MARAVIRAGDHGAGQAAKICNNMVLGVSMIGDLRGLRPGREAGPGRRAVLRDRLQVLRPVLGLTSYCPWPGPVPAAPSNRGYEGGFATAMMLKDLKLAQEAAAKAGAATPLGAQAEALYALFDRLGGGGKDFSAILELFRGQLRRAKLIAVHECRPSVTKGRDRDGCVYGQRRPSAPKPRPHQREPAAAQHRTRDPDETSMDYKAAFEDAVEQVRAEGRYRVFADLKRHRGEFPRATWTRADGATADVVVWCSNDYLGQGQNPVVIEAMHRRHRRGRRRLGRHAQHLRHHPLSRRAGAELADLHGKEAALLFTSGYVSNEATLATLHKILPGLIIFSDALNHTSMISRHPQRRRRSSTIFRHNDLEHLEELLAARRPTRPS